MNRSNIKSIRKDVLDLNCKRGNDYEIGMLRYFYLSIKEDLERNISEERFMSILKSRVEILDENYEEWKN